MLRPAQSTPVVEGEGEAGPEAVADASPAAAVAAAAAAGSAWVLEQVTSSEMQAMVRRRERCFEYHVTFPMLELALIGIATHCKGQKVLMDTNEKWLERKHLGVLAGVVQCVMAVMGGTTISKIAKSAEMTPRTHWMTIREIIERDVEGAWFQRMCQFKDVCLQGNVYVDRLRGSRRFRRDRRFDHVSPIRSRIKPQLKEEERLSDD